ncbi:unnamed protein product [Trichobilharzia szidati]|nr:unnamed protein product [Trichobilharzia szidati]
MLSCISNWCKKQLDSLQSRQQKILKSSKDAELSDEQNYYSSIRKIIRNHEYALNSYNDYLARTSNYEYLKQARQKQLSAIDASRIGRQLNKAKQNLDGESSLKSSLESNEDVRKNGPIEREVKHHPHHHHHHQHHNHRTEVVIPSNISIHGTESTAYHKTDIDKLNVTAFCSQSVTIDSTPKHLFMHPTKMEEELLKVIELKQSQMTNESDEDCLN